MEERKARKLGRGLSSLIEEPVAVAVGEGDVRDAVASATTNVAIATRERWAAAGGAVAPAAAPEVDAGRGLVEVGVEEIAPSPFQARADFEDGALKTLADSIKRTGMMQPVILRRVGGRFELVAGERRWRAAKVVGLKRVPAVVRDLSDEEAAEWGVVENVQREDLNPMERARAYRMLGERFALSQEQIAARVGQERSTVANFMRLTELEAEVQALIAARSLSPGHGKALLMLDDGALRVKWGKMAAAQGWSVRRLEEACRRVLLAGELGRDGHLARQEREFMNPKRIAREAVEKRLSEHLGTKVRVVTRKDGAAGRIVIQFFGLDQFDGVMQRMGCGE